MARELTNFERVAAEALCNERHPDPVAEEASCPACRADIVRLVDASPSETTGGEDAIKAASARRENFMYTALERVIADIERGEVQQRTLTLARRALTPAAYAEHWCRDCGGTVKPHDDHPELYHCVEWCGSLDPKPALRAAPPAGDGVPEVREEDVALASDRMAAYDRMADEWARIKCAEAERRERFTADCFRRIAAALSYCATRQGER